MNREQWIEDIIKNGKQLQGVSANPFLATRVEAKLQRPMSRNVPIRSVYAFALVMLLLVFANIMVLQGKDRRKEGGIQSLMQEYGWNNNDLYSVNIPK